MLIDGDALRRLEYLLRYLEDIAAGNLALLCNRHVSSWRDMNLKFGNLPINSNTLGSSSRGTVLKGALIKPRA